jgi:hypothetical protein
VGKGFTSWLLTLGEYGRHGDLRGSGRLSVYPTSTGELSCIVLKHILPEPFLFLTPWKWRPPEPFIAQGRVVYNESRGLTGGPEVVETLYSS